MRVQKMILVALTAASLLAFRSAGTARVSHKRFFHPQVNGTVSVVIIKETYELKVYDQDGWYATYPVVFGSKSLDDKMMEGDRKTPEGLYHIASKRPHEKWDKMMLIDFPTSADMEKFKERKAQGLIPKGAKIGGGIAIHGTWPHDDIAVDMYQNWTNGCISLKNEDVDELYDMLPVGAQVLIKKTETE
ncbi:MAG TPA: L,D-transpeptidase [Puia sp.]|nr:L,D-transpeptidase [Puia sp.]